MTQKKLLFTGSRFDLTRPTCWKDGRPLEYHKKSVCVVYTEARAFFSPFSRKRTVPYYIFRLLVNPQERLVSLSIGGALKISERARATRQMKRKNQN